jgi:hypothetical protein
MTNSADAGTDRAPRPAGTVDFTMMLVGHAAFARDLRRLELAVERGQAGTSLERARWAMFTKQLHTHHRAEDLALWPALREKVVTPDEVKILDKMEMEHARIDPEIERIDDALTTGGRTRLVANVRDLSASLTEHMRNEENEALPLVETYLGPAGWATFVAAIRKEQGLRSASEFLPWLLDGAPQEVEAKVLKLLPPPARFIYRRRWASRYQRAAGMNA